MNSETSIDALVADLRPVRRVRPTEGRALATVLLVTAIAGVILLYGARPDVLGGHPDFMVTLRGGVLLLLGLASLLAVTASARPGVGPVSNGWMWILAAALLFPVAALVQMLWLGGVPDGALAPAIGLYCLKISGTCALIIGTALTLWLRQGAPTAIPRASWLVGLTAGSFGTVAYSLHCPVTNIYYIGLWYTLAVGMAAVTARLIVPRIVRW